jgi:hypothetical protein
LRIRCGPSAPCGSFCLSNPDACWYNFPNYLTLHTRFNTREEHPLRLAPILSAILLLIFCSSPYAQVFYQYPEATTVEPGRFDVGTYLSGGEDLFRLGGFSRLGIARYWDVGFEVLVENDNGDWRGGAGGDARYQLLPTTAKVPFDLSADAGFGFASGDNVTIYQAPLGGIISSPLKMDNGTVITPYLGVYAVFVRTKIKRPGLSDLSDNDVEALLRGGVSVDLTENLEIFGTLQLGPYDLASVGINYRL